MHNRAGKRETHFDIPGTLLFTFESGLLSVKRYLNFLILGQTRLTTVHGG